MELLQITLAANETKQFAKAGRYFEIIDSLYSINVNFTGASGALTDALTNALSGLFVEDPFSHFSVTNGATAQTVTLLIMESGRGGSRRQPGNVTVIDAVAPQVQTLAVASLAIQPFTATTIVLPAANTAGIVIRGVSLEVQAGAGGNADCAVVCAPTVPASNVGANMLCLGRLVDAAGTRQIINSWDLRKKIPTGWGIWLVTVNLVTAATANAARCSFELL